MASYSHPDKLLSEHLMNVAEESKNKILKKKLNLKWDTSKIADFAYYIGMFHDFGKFTQHFQEYIHEVNEKKKALLKNKPEVKHGHISALFSYYCFKNILKFDGDIALLSYFIIKKHHGNLTSIKSEINNTKSGLETIKSQLKSIDCNEVNTFYRFIHDFDISKFERFLNNEDLIFELDESAGDIEDEDIFLLNNMLFSVLIDSDKKDAAGIHEFERLYLNSSLVDLYRQETFNLDSKEEIDILRNDIYTKVMDEKNFDMTNSIFSITAPTGSGKTLTALSYALKLRSKIRDKLGISPRIIYCLPFTSIIDQNYREIEKVLSENVKDYTKNFSRYLIKHHHLSNISYTAESEVQHLEDSLMYIESWNSEIIVTTFVQLFTTLLGNTNVFLKKFHNLANSIILVDEIQNIPIKYWKLVDHVFNLLSEKLGCNIILLTATKPLIFEEGECEELLIKSEEDRKKYFEHEELNRTRLEIKIKERLDITQFFNNINIKRLIQENKSIMFVFNTIQSSLDFYNLVKDCGCNIEYLSSNIIPTERRKRIDKIKEDINKVEKVILITTQLVEAGVDLDFDVVFRDMGPIDSIIQVAGRCNRNGKKQQSKVFIYNLIDRNSREYGSYVYQDLILIAKQVLRKEVIQEKEFFCLIDDYFKLTKQKKSQDVSNQLIKKLRELVYFVKDKQTKGVESLADFKLIEELPELIDVFIEIDEEAKSVWKEYSNLNSIQDRIKRKIEFLKIKNRLREYIISIHKKFLNDFSLGGESILRIPQEMLEQYYDNKVGFIRKNWNVTATFI